jgi:hypothetical protein
MGRRFITAHDVDDLAASGDRELRLDAGTRLTDLARERARDHGIAIVAAGATSGGAGPRAAPPTPAPAPAPAPAPSAHDDGTPRRQLRAAVRAGVVEEFGGVPEGIDAAIGRVFDRLGIRD